jgi:UDP-glucose 4-epimerase
VEGASTESHTRSWSIGAAALRNEPISVIKHNGTQFVWAEDLARLYDDILTSTVNRKTHFGLSKNFVSWQTSAQETVRRCDSSSPIQVDDRG